MISYKMIISHDTLVLLKYDFITYNAWSKKAGVFSAEKFYYFLTILMKIY